MKVSEDEWGQGASDIITTPLASIIVYKANKTDKEFKRIVTKRFMDFKHIPIEIDSLQYNAGDIFAVDVKYDWIGNKGNDYTVKVYSKMDIEITDSLDRKVQLHTDGQSPTEFRKSKYCGMDINCTPNEPFTGKDKDANTETYSGDKWYLKAEIPKTIFSA